MSKSFDLVAIGSGAAASGVAMKCRKAGWSVALIDSQPLGGTCAVRGCDPKKVLVGATEALDWTARLNGKGVRAAEAKIDWRELMHFKRSFTEPVPAELRWADVEALLRALGAELKAGKGSRVRVTFRGCRATFHRPHPRPAVSPHGNAPELHRTGRHRRVP